MFRRFATDNSTLAYRVRAVTAIAGIAGMLLSWQAWLPASARRFPVAPALRWIPDLPAWAGWTLAIAAVLLLAVQLLRTPPRRATIALGAVFGALVLLDQTRLQPWVFQYALILTTLHALPPRREGAYADALDLVRTVLIATYAWSGIHKMNLSFFLVAWPWMNAPLLDAHPALTGAVTAAGVLVPFVELSIAAGLFFTKTRRVALWAVIAMHLTILALLGPYGRDHNAVVWPWNEALILIDFLLFSSSRPIRLPAIAEPLPNALFEKTVLLIAAVLPAFALVGAYDAYLSHALYSGRAHRATMTFDRAAAARLPEGIWKNATTVDDAYVLDLSHYSFVALGVPPYPEPRVFKAIGRGLCETVGGRGATLRITGVPGLMTLNAPVHAYTCDDL